MRSINVPVLNSLIFIRDASIEDIPEIDGLAAYWSTKSCVAISCLPDSEGNTTITIGDGGEIALHSSPLLDLNLETPSSSIVIENVVAATLMKADVTSATTRLRVWTNGHRATDIVLIALN